MGEAFELVLWSSDVPALVGFLEQVIGARVAEQFPGFADVRVDGFRIQVHADEAYRGHPWYESLAREGVARGIGCELRFRVEDVFAAYRRALAAGAVPVQPPYELDAALESVLVGPDGYLFTLWAPRSHS